MIAHRIVAAFLGTERPHAPSGEHVVGHQPFGQRRCLIAIEQSRGEAMSGVRGHYAAGLLVAVERERDHAIVVEPEVARKVCFERLGSIGEPRCVRIAVQPRRHLARSKYRRRTRTPAPHIARSAARASVPSACEIESKESFQP